MYAVPGRNCAAVPDPFVVLEFDIVGSAEVPPHTPRAVTVAPPLLVTFPPDIAVVAVIPLTAVVVTVGRAATKPMFTRKVMVAPAELLMASILSPPAPPAVRKHCGFFVSSMAVRPASVEYSALL
jgi:hypothetical protein